MKSSPGGVPGIQSVFARMGYAAGFVHVLHKPCALRARLRTCIPSEGQHIRRTDLRRPVRTALRLADSATPEHPGEGGEAPDAPSNVLTLEITGKSTASEVLGDVVAWLRSALFSGTLTPTTPMEVVQDDSQAWLRYLTSDGSATSSQLVFAVKTDPRGSEGAVRAIVELRVSYDRLAEAPSFGSTPRPVGWRSVLRRLCTHLQGTLGTANVRVSYYAPNLRLGKLRSARPASSGRIVARIPVEPAATQESIVRIARDLHEWGEGCGSGRVHPVFTAFAPAVQ